MSVDGADTSQRQIDAVSASMNRLSDTVHSAMRNLASTIGIGGGLVQIVQLTDQYTKFDSQLRLATQSQREYVVASADVRRIAKEAQADLAGTGVLYARIANGTRELGVSQARVASITEVVNLSLKVSAATTAEAASAQLQLSQAFASGTLRGEEFNAVNEAAPRLMKALADGMGVPIGALKQMASDGKITSAVMAEVLPGALETLRREAEQVQTIGGAFTVLKNNVMEFTAVSAQSNGVVSLLTGGIGLLANNLAVVMGVLTTMTAVKVGTWFAGAATNAYQSAAANRALATSTLAAAEAEVAATGAAAALAAARVTELRAAVLAAEGSVALAIATNGLIPAQARAIALAEAHALALAGQTTAMRAASVAGGVLRGAMAFLGGPIGLVITALGIAATAWSVMGSSAKAGADKAAGAVRESTDEILSGLDKQIAKLQERNRLHKMGIPTTKTESAANVRLGEVMTAIDQAGRGTGEYAGLDMPARIELLKVLGGEYGRLTEKIATFNKETAESVAGTRNDQLKKWFDENGTNAQKLAAELEKLKLQFGTIPPEMEKLVRARYADKGAATAIRQEETAYTSLVTAIGEKIAAGKLELSGYDKLSDAQKLTIKLDEAIISGKNKLSPAHIAEARSKIAIVEAQDLLIASQKRAAKGAEEMQKVFDDYADSVAKAIDNAEKEAAKNEDLARTFGMTKGAIEQFELARLEEQLAQRSSTALTLDEITALEKLIEAKKRSAVALTIVDGLEEQKKSWESAEKTAHDFFTSIGRKGESTFDRLKQSLKGGLLETLWQMTAKKWIFNIQASVTGGASGISSAAGAVSNVANAGSVGNSLLSLVGSAGSIISAAGSTFGSAAVSAFGSGLSAGAAGTSVAEAAAAYSAAGYSGVAGGLSAGASIGSATSGLISGASSMLAAIPGWGWAALGAAALYAYFGDSGPEDHTRIGFTSNNTAGNISINERGNEGKNAAYIGSASTSSSLGTFGVSSSFWAQDQSATVKSFLSTVSLTDDALSRFMTATEKASVSNYLTGKVSIAHTGAEGADPNANGELDGVFRDRIRNIMEGLEPGLASLVAGFSGTSQALATEVEGLLQYRAALKDSGEAVFGAKVTLQEIAALKTPTEGTSAALVRITGEFNTTNQVLGLLGKSSEEAFGAGGLASAAARTQLVQLSGGVSAMATQAAAFAQNYFTDAERLEPVSKALDASLAGLGLNTIPTTRLEFRKLVNDLTSGGVAATEAGARQLTGLMALAEQFAQVHPLIEETTAALSSQTDVLSQRADLDKQIDQLTLTSVQLRAKERESIDATNLSRFDQITLLQQQAEETANAAAAEKEVLGQRADLQKQLNQLTMTSAQLRAKERESIDTTNLAIFDQITRRQEATATATALKTVFDNLKAGRDSIIGYRDSLQMGTLSTLTPLQRYMEAQRQYTAALDKAKSSPADSSAQSAAQTAASTFLTASQVINASSLAFVTDRSKVLGDMTSLADIAGAQMSDTEKQIALADQQLAAADQQVTALTAINTTTAAIQQTIVDLGVPAALSAASFDFKQYTAQANAGNEALVTEIKALRQTNADTVAELRLLRLDAERQAVAQVAATAATAVTVAEEVGDAVERAGWKTDHSTRRVAL